MGWRRRFDRRRHSRRDLFDDRCFDNHRGGSFDDRLGLDNRSWCGDLRCGFGCSSLLGRLLPRLGRLFGLDVSL